MRKRHDEQQWEQRRDVLQEDWKRKGGVLNAMRSVVASDQAKAKPEVRERHRREREALATRFIHFKQYHEAVGADRYRVTAIRLRENGTKLGFVLDKRGGTSVGLTTRWIA